MYLFQISASRFSYWIHCSVSYWFQQMASWIPTKILSWVELHCYYKWNTENLLKVWNRNIFETFKICNIYSYTDKFQTIVDSKIHYQYRDVYCFMKTVPMYWYSSTFCLICHYWIYFCFIIFAKVFCCSSDTLNDYIAGSYYIWWDFILFMILSFHLFKCATYGHLF